MQNTQLLELEVEEDHARASSHSAGDERKQYPFLNSKSLLSFSHSLTLFSPALSLPFTSLLLSSSHFLSNSRAPDSLTLFILSLFFLPLLSLHSLPLILRLSLALPLGVSHSLFSPSFILSLPLILFLKLVLSPSSLALSLTPPSGPHSIFSLLVPSLSNSRSIFFFPSSSLLSLLVSLSVLLTHSSSQLHPLSRAHSHPSHFVFPSDPKLSWPMVLSLLLPLTHSFTLTSSPFFQTRLHRCSSSSLF